MMMAKRGSTENKILAVAAEYGVLGRIGGVLGSLYVPLRVGCLTSGA